MKWLLGLVGIALLVAGVFVFTFLRAGMDDEEVVVPQTDNIVIGLSMGTLRSERWVQDRDFIIERANELGAEVIVMSANEDPDTQVSQAENLILQGVDVLIVVAEDGEKASAIVDKAHAAGIQVIAYDRLIKHPDLNYYLSFDNEKVGEYQAQYVIDAPRSGNKVAYVGGSPTDNNAFLVKKGAMSVLQPLIDAGTIQLVYDEFTDDWKQEEAYVNMKTFLASGETVDAIIAANDSTASGVIQALDEVGLAGRVPVSGQDAALAAVQYLVSGKQTVTIYKPIKELAYKSVDMAVAIVNGVVPETNNMTTNGVGITPSLLLDVVAVTKDNIEETIIKDKFHDRSEIYGK